MIGIPRPKNMSNAYGRGIFGPEVQRISDDVVWEQAHLYVLHNTMTVDRYIAEHMAYLKAKHPSRAKREVWLQDEHNRTFIKWFANNIEEQVVDGVLDVDNTLKWLARGPSKEVLKYNGYVINGCRYYTEQYDERHVVQNSGVTLVATTMQVSSAKDNNPIISDMAYFGVIEEIWELDYMQFRLPVFKCKWIESNGGIKVDDMGFKLVDFSRIGHKREPFILASQAKQVFYVEDPMNPKWKVVLSFNLRHDHGTDALENFDHDMSTFTRGFNGRVDDDGLDDEPNYLVAGEGTWVEKSRKRKKWLVKIVNNFSEMYFMFIYIYVSIYINALSVYIFFSDH